MKQPRKAVVRFRKKPFSFGFPVNLHPGGDEAREISDGGGKAEANGGPKTFLSRGGGGLKLTLPPAISLSDGTNFKMVAIMGRKMSVSARSLP